MTASTSARRISWLVALLLLAGAGASGNTIVVQPVIVGGAIDSTVNDTLFGDAIFAQIAATVTLLPELVSTTLPTDMIDFGTSDNLPLYLADSTFRAGPVLTVWYVNTIDGSGSGVRGVSFQSGTSFGIGIADLHVDDTLSHEVAHVLTDFSALWDPDPVDPSHSTDPYNLLAAGTIRLVPGSTADVYPNGLGYDQIQPIQIAAMTSSPFYQFTVPEPGTFVQAGVVIIACFIVWYRIVRSPHKPLCYVKSVGVNAISWPR
jgi:hypothetical protein